MQYFSYKFKAMGTPCEIQLFANSNQHAKDTANIVISDVNRLEVLYSRYRQDSFYLQSIVMQQQVKALLSMLKPQVC